MEIFIYKRHLRHSRVIQTICCKTCSIATGQFTAPMAIVQSVVDGHVVRDTLLVWGSTLRRTDDITCERRHEGLYVTIVPLWW